MIYSIFGCTSRLKQCSYLKKRLYGLRWASSSSRRTQHKFQLDAVPFLISPSNAFNKFIDWSSREQGIKFMFNPADVKISAVYVPVWAFDLNVRFVNPSAAETKTGMYKSKPKLFDAYQMDVVHLQGWAAYSGYTYRRSLINPVHNKSLMFLGENIVPFESSQMLQNMKLENGQVLEIYPDPWNATKNSAFHVVEQDLKRIAEEDSYRIGKEIQVETEMLHSRRVYMPTYIFHYKILGLEFEAFISGCDTHAKVSGMTHATFSHNATISPFFNDLLKKSHVYRMLHRNQTEGFATLLFTLLNYLFKATLRVITRFHMIGIVGGAGYVTFRKLIKPWMDSRTASSAWERQRDHEAQMKDHGTHDYTNNFMDDGSARRYFYTNRNRILASMRSEKIDDFWYTTWDTWVRQQWESQQQSQRDERTQKNHTQGSNKSKTSARNSSGYEGNKSSRARDESYTSNKGNFDKYDPYSVLNVRKDASKAEISQAFRREMLKYHPDTDSNASLEERNRLTERSKIITDAYRKIKADIR